MKKMITNLKALALCAGLAMAGVGTAWADAEPNNSFAEANSIPLNTAVNGSLGTPPTDGSDYYQVALSAAGTVSVSADFGAALNGRIFLYNPSGAQIGVSGSGTGTQSVSVNCVGSAFVYVLIFRNSGAGNYAFTATLASPVLAADSEPNNTFALVNSTYTEGQNFTGQLGYSNNGVVDASDYFFYTSDRNGSITFSVTADPSLSYRLYLYRSNGGLIGFSAIGSGSLSLTVDCTAEGSYYALVFLNGGCGAYTAQLNNSTLPNANDAEPNNTFASAIETFVENETFSGQLGHVAAANGTIDNSDYFIYEHPRNGAVTFSAEGSDNLSYRLYLYRANGGLVGVTTIGTGEVSLTLDCLAPGSYRGLVFHNSGCGSYSAAFNSSTLTYENDIEPNNTFATAIETFVENETFSGQLGHAAAANGTIDNSDYFIYEHPRNGAVTFSAEGSDNLSYRLWLYRANGVLVGFSAIGTGELSLTLDCLAPGSYRGLVFHNSGCGSYSASFSSNALTYSDDEEPNNTFADAPLTWVTKYNEGQLGHAATANGTIDGSDYYTIKVTEVPFTLSFPYEFKETLSARIWLYNQNGSSLKFDPIVGPNTPSTFTHTINTIGVYYLLVFHNSGCGSYRFGAPCESGSDVDMDNICDGEDTCLANGGIISLTSGTPTNCLGDNFDDIVQVAVTGKYAQGTFGLVTFPAQDVMALSASGTFDMSQYPEGNYRIAHVGTPSLASLQGITNADQLSGCYNLSNFIAVNNVTLIPGTITANNPTTVCGDDGIASNVSFSSTGATGPTFRWAVLDQTASTLLANNTTGTFNFDTFGPGTYKITRAVFSGLNPLLLDPQDLPACIRRSNLITVNVTSCGGPAALMSQPNPSTGISTVTFTLPETGHASLEVYDMSGRMLRAIYNAQAEQGQDYRFDFDGSHLPNGVYLYRLSTDKEVVIEKFMIAK